MNIKTVTTHLPVYTIPEYIAALVALNPKDRREIIQLKPLLQHGDLKKALTKVLTEYVGTVWPFILMLGTPHDNDGQSCAFCWGSDVVIFPYEDLIR